MYHVSNILCKDKDVKNAGTVYSDVLDTGAAKLGDVEPIYLELWSDVNAVGADGRLAVTLQSATDEAFTSPEDEAISISGLTAANLVKGKFLTVAIPYNIKRYVRVKFVTSTVASSTFTTANVSAYLRQAV